MSKCECFSCCMSGKKECCKVNTNFLVTTGTTADDIISGPQVMNSGSTLHFYSQDLDIIATPGSARVEYVLKSQYKNGVTGPMGSYPRIAVDTRPMSPNIGDIIYLIPEKKFERYNGFFWEEIFICKLRSGFGGVVATVCDDQIPESLVIRENFGNLVSAIGNNIPDLSGKRLTYDKNLSALRFGYADSGIWNPANVGENSLAFGKNNIASGFGSLAGGETNNVSGEFSSVFGSGNTVSGKKSLAYGTNNVITGNESYSFGSQNNIQTNKSSAFGSDNLILAEHSFAIGNSNTIQSERSVAMGYFCSCLDKNTFSQGNDNTSNGENAVTHGKKNLSSGINSVAIGLENVSSSENSFCGGQNCNSTAKNSFCFGKDSNSNGEVCVCFGSNNECYGLRNFCSGESNTCSGENNMVIGSNNQNNGKNSMVIGKFGVVSGVSSFGGGDNFNVSSNDSLCYGKSNTCSNDVSFCFGEGNVASGRGSMSQGYNTQSNGIACHSEGDGTIANGNFSHSEGIKTISSGIASHSEGFQCRALGDYSHAQGTNCFSLGVNSFSSGTNNTVSGTNSVVFGNNCNNVAVNSILMGNNCTSSGFQCCNFGNSNNNSGTNSICFGSNNVSNGIQSFAEGYFTTASGQNSHALGRETVASNTNSVASGYRTYTSSDGVFIMGQNGKSFDTPYSFQFACGSSIPVNDGDGIGAIIKCITPGQQPTAEIMAKTISSSFPSADYAEYFEWADGNPLNEDRIGRFVKLNGNKIELCDQNDDIIGVTSRTSLVEGDAAALRWHKSIITDEFGRVLEDESYKLALENILMKYEIVSPLKYEEPLKHMISKVLNVLTVKIPDILSKKIDSINGYKIDSESFLRTQTENKEIGDKMEFFSKYFMMDELQIINILKSNNYFSKLCDFYFANISSELKKVKPIKITKTNPDFDPTKQYIPRSERKEWHPVGLIGKLYVIDNGRCIVGKKCGCDKNGYAIPGNKYYVMERTHPNVVRILLK